MSKISVSPSTFLYLALLLLTVPVQWVLGIAFAVLGHELGHLLALKMLRVQILGFRIDVSGAVIETGETDSLHELLCAAAGPAAGALMIFMAKWFPEMALCALVQTAFNLIPIYPLDGGRMLRCILSILFPLHYAQIVCNVLTALALAAVVLVSVYFFRFKTLGVIPILCVALLWRKIVSQKNSLQR